MNINISFLKVDNNLEIKFQFSYTAIMNRIEILKKHYEPRLEKYSENSKILDWENPGAQYKRFSALTDNYDLRGKSVLDVGCGCGDFYGWLDGCGISAGYYGVDILEKMVKKAAESYPEAEFHCADIFSPDFAVKDEFGLEQFDVTFTSGIFNLNAGNNAAFFRRAVPVLSALSKQAFVFNLLNPESPDKDERYFYVDPETAIDLASGYADKIEMVQGYLDNDYTLICRKNV
jgi:SAM-dependent methyltransferase